jgi:hypothetical protein
MDLSRDRIARASLRTVFAYSTMMAIYLMVNSITHPMTLGMPVTHVISWPTEETVLVFAQLCSVLSFFVLRVLVYASNFRKELSFDG